MSEIDFPNNMATYREKRGLTATEIAVEMGVTHSSVYKWESGTRFPRSPRVMIPIIERAYRADKSELWPTIYGRS